VQKRPNQGLFWYSAWQRRANRQAGLTIPEKSLTRGAWRTRGYRQAVSECRGCFKALCAWRYATPARRSGSWQRLAVRVPLQAICTVAALKLWLCICDLQGV